MTGQLLQKGAFLTPGDPAKFNDSALFDGGVLGKYFITDKGNPFLAVGGTALAPRVYQIVQLDSGSGVTYGQVLVWKDYTNFVVTTVASNTKRNDVAGFNTTGTVTTAGAVTSTATAGNYIAILVGGLGLILNENGTTPAAGDAVIGGATTAGRSGITAQGTAPLASQLGVALGAKLAAFGGITPTTDYIAANIYPRVFAF